jgi:hypothetical protein
MFIKKNKVDDEYLAAKLNVTMIGLRAIMTRKTWTLRFALEVAHKLALTINVNAK